jgi:murein DD-endopeptidase MepM/ murein hydrolase activator NlpD
MLNRRRFLASLTSTLALIAAWRPAWAQPTHSTTVTFILFNDFYLMGEQPFPDGKQRGGFARLAAMVKAERARAAAEGRNVIVAHGGDTLSPSIMSGLDRGEFEFDEAPPAGGPEASGETHEDGSAQVPELTTVLDVLETQIQDRERQLTVLETLLASRELGVRGMPGGLPLIGGWISSHFGHRTDPFTGHGAFHSGVDFAGAPGSKVIAVGHGVVSFAGYKSGYGNVVEITHPTGYLTRYGHNSRNLVRVGQAVKRGDRIAVIGSTGRSTGTHVHFEVLQDGKVLNPKRYLTDERG